MPRLPQSFGFVKIVLTTVPRIHLIRLTANTPTHSSRRHQKPECSRSEQLEPVYVRRQPPYYSSYENLATAKIMDETTGNSRLRADATTSKPLAKMNITDSDGNHFHPDFFAAFSAKKTVTDSDGNYFDPDIRKPIPSKSKALEQKSIYDESKGDLQDTKSHEERAAAEKYYDIF